MLAAQLGDDYLQTIEQHLHRLRLRGGVLLSGELGEGNHGTGYVLHEPPQTKRAWTQRLQDWRERLTATERSSHVYQLADRDEAGHRALSELRGRGIGAVAATLGRSSDHVLAFFATLRLELAFYTGCLNLHDRLARKHEPVCMPRAGAAGAPQLSAQALYDVSLSLRVEQRVVGSDLGADGKRLVFITGANRGGKSTCLRALGQAQLMMQAGLFVAAQSFQADVRDGLFTHFKREEDRGMRSGKLDEELARMSGIVDRLKANSMVLFNESFASTNEREGSEIARQIVSALLEAGVKVIYVTHLFDLAQSFYGGGTWDALFLQAERLADGRRTFRLVPGEPLPTSYGADLYDRIFGLTPGTAPPAPAPARSPADDCTSRSARSGTASRS
jgi:DNA mismatch repair ATPase MutS